MDNAQISHLLQLQEASRQGKLVIFVGAGVSNNSGVPTWVNLTNALRQKLSQSIQKEADDLKVAQIFKDSHGEKEFMETVRNALKDGKVAYNPIHNCILQLSPVHIITTNYDDLIEQAIVANYKQYDVISKDSDLPHYQYPNKVIKMHGDFKTGNIVLSEEDYYNYAFNFPLIRAFITSLFTTNVVLFVGFSFADLNLKIILNDIKTVLDERMQRVYLLASETVDEGLSEYYLRKGINVISIDNPDEYAQAYNIEFNQADLAKLTIEKGKILYKQLAIIDQLNIAYASGLVDLLDLKLKTYQTELTVLGDGLKYVIPKDERPMWNYHSYGLQLFSDSIKTIAKELKTYKGKRSFVERYNKKQRHFLMQQALLNRIYCIDDLRIITSKNYDRVESEIEKDPTLNLFYSLDFIEVSNFIRELRSQGMFYNKRDLLLPYLLCRMGRYYEAYQQYQKLIPAFWSKGLYVLYFICLYNLYQIRYFIYQDVLSRPDIDGQIIVDEIEKFDLEEVLSKLPIDKALKQTLKDLFTYKFFSEKSKEADDLSRQIVQQKSHANRGGGSINENIYRLVAKFQQTLNFCIRNCMEFRNSYFGTLVKDTIIGILNSHSTKTNKILGGKIAVSKIYEIEEEHLFAILFFIDTKDLSEIMLQCDISEIILNKESIIFLDSLIDNLYNSIVKNGDLSNLSIPLETISPIIGNLVLTIGKASNASHISKIEKLYEILHLTWKVPMCFSYDKHLYLMVGKCPPSDKMATELLADSIINDPFEQNNLAVVITKQFTKNNVVFDRIRDVSQLVKENNWHLGLILYKILPIEMQTQYVEYIQQNINEIELYLKILDNLQVEVRYVEHFNELLNKYKCNNNEDIVFICRYLVALRKNALFNNVHQIIDDFGKRHEAYKFFLAPLEYSNKERIMPSWILCCSDEEIKELLKNDSIKVAYKNFMQNNELGKLNYDKLFKLL